MAGGTPPGASRFEAGAACRGRGAGHLGDAGDAGHAGDRRKATGYDGGQRQRLALARALYGSPVLLVLDEPNSALDAEGSEALNEAVKAMTSEGKSVVIMTHRPVAIQSCDNLLVLDRGRVAGFGPRDEIVRSMLTNAEQVKKSIYAGGRG